MKTQSPHQPLANRPRAAASPWWRVLTLTALVATGATGLAGCAALNQLSSEVSTYGEWPAGRAPASFAFDRLPSQASRAKDQDALEAMALPALQAAGFTPAAAGTAADVLVQVGARVDRAERSPWDDPIWGRAWGPRWRLTPWAGPYWVGHGPRSPEYTREVAVLIRDRASGTALYEARASTDGLTQGGSAILTAMFSAALKEFPAVKPEAHSVSATLP